MNQKEQELRISGLIFALKSCVTESLPNVTKIQVGLKMTEAGSVGKAVEKY